jgi:hypothetical protein
MNDPVSADDFKEHEDYSSYSLKDLHQYLKLCETTRDYYQSLLDKVNKNDALSYVYNAQLQIMLVDIEDVKKEIEKRNVK